MAHIRDRFHEVHGRELADAVALADRIDGGGELSAHLATMMGLIGTHQRKEEAVIFPAMLRGGRQTLRLPLRQMADEHAELERMTDRLDQLTTGFEPSPGACVRQRLLYTLCRKIVADLREHARLEDEVLFPRFQPFASAQRRPADRGVDESHGAVDPRVSHQG